LGETFQGRIIREGEKEVKGRQRMVRKIKKERSVRRTNQKYSGRLRPTLKIKMGGQGGGRTEGETEDDQRFCRGRRVWKRRVLKNRRGRGQQHAEAGMERRGKTIDCIYYKFRVTVGISTEGNGRGWRWQRVRKGVNGKKCKGKGKRTVRPRTNGASDRRLGEGGPDQWETGPPEGRKEGKIQNLSRNHCERVNSK